MPDVPSWPEVGVMPAGSDGHCPSSSPTRRRSVGSRASMSCPVRNATRVVPLPASVGEPGVGRSASTSRLASSTSAAGAEDSPRSHHRVVGRGRGCRLQFGPQRRRLRGIAHPVRDELAEQSLISGHARDLPVAKGGDLAGERISPPREIPFVDVVQQHQADRVQDGDQGGAVAGGRQPIPDQLQQPVVTGEDDRFLPGSAGRTSCARLRPSAMSSTVVCSYPRSSKRANAASASRIRTRPRARVGW